MTPIRIPVAAARTQSRRVEFTMSRIVRTPWPASPTGQGGAVCFSPLARALAPGRGAEDALQAGRIHIVENRADASPRLADEPGVRVLVLDLGRGVGPVPE